MDFGFEKIMDFTMNIDKHNLATLVGKVKDEIMEYQIFVPKCTEYRKIKAKDLQKITKPFLHRKSQILRAKIAKPLSVFSM